MTAKRPELFEATNETIADAVQYADPMVLRGLLYQLTGDDDLDQVNVESVQQGGRTRRALTDADAAPGAIQGARRSYNRAATLVPMTFPPVPRSACAVVSASL